MVFSSSFGGFPFITFHVAYMASQKRLNLNVHKSFWNLEELFTQFIYENLLSNFAVLGDKIRRRLKRATQCFGEVFYYLDGGLIFSIFLQSYEGNLTLVNKGYMQRDTLQVCWDEPKSTFISEFNLFFEGNVHFSVQTISSFSKSIKLEAFMKSANGLLSWRR